MTGDDDSDETVSGERKHKSSEVSSGSRFEKFIDRIVIHPKRTETIKPPPIQKPERPNRIPGPRQI